MPPNDLNMSLKKVSESNTKAPPTPEAPGVCVLSAARFPAHWKLRSVEFQEGVELVQGVGRQGEPAWVTFLGKGIGLKTWKKNQEFMGSATQGHFV